MNEEGMIIPISMRNYQERTILGGFIRLRKYERMDLFWGYLENQERDLIYLHLLIAGMTLLIFAFVVFTSNQ